MIIISTPVLADYFGKNKGAPHYLTPVYFDKAVLQKYFGSSSEYEVQDSAIHKHGYWRLRFDNNSPGHVCVFLGDLGRDIPHSEQIYNTKQDRHVLVTGTNSNGAIAWRERYTPFGITLDNESANDDQAGYTGYIEASNTGLVYMQARYYDPVIGRFYSD